MSTEKRERAESDPKQHSEVMRRKNWLKTEEFMASSCWGEKIIMNHSRRNIRILCLPDRTTSKLNVMCSAERVV